MGRHEQVHVGHATSQHSEDSRPATAARSPDGPSSDTCRRCKYDLAGLGITTDAEQADLCPECALPLRLSRGPWLGELGAAPLLRVASAARTMGWGFDLTSAAALMILAMTIVGAHYWLDPGSVPSLNGIVITCAAAGWLLVIAGAALARVTDPITGHQRGGWLSMLMIAAVLLPLALVALAAANVYLGYLGRATSTKDSPTWSSALPILGILGAVFTFFLLLTWFSSQGSHGPNSRETDMLMLAALVATLQSYAWAFRLCGRDIRQFATLKPC